MCSGYGDRILILIAHQHIKSQLIRAKEIPMLRYRSFLPPRRSSSRLHMRVRTQLNIAG
jgi:hypothetical protein